MSASHRSHADHQVSGKGEIIARVRDREHQIRMLGVRRLAIFGSFARGDARADSDIDFLVEFEANRKSFDSFMELADLLESLLGRRVELVTIESLSPHIGPRILGEAEDVVRAA